MNFVLVGLAIALIALFIWVYEQQRHRHAHSLQELINGADELERQLLECRKHMHEIKRLLAELPEEMTADADSALSADDKIDEALRDLLAHRLWIKHKARSAGQDKLDDAVTAMRKSTAVLHKQLRRLNEMTLELTRARTTSNAPTRLSQFP